MNSAIFGLLLVQSFLAASVGVSLKETNTLPMSLSDYSKRSTNIQTEDNAIKRLNAADGSLLLDLVRNGALRLQTDDMKQSNVVDIKRDEVYAHLLQNGGLRTDFTKPSIGFMLKVCKYSLYCHDFNQFDF